MLRILVKRYANLPGNDMAKVKICGITSLKDALAAQDSGADFLGFVFADSPRKVAPEKAGEIIAKLSPSVKIVALFVNEIKDKVFEAVQKMGRVDLLQFHGDETSKYCQCFTEQEIIKVFRIRNEASIAPIRSFDGIDFVLLDTFEPGRYGGTGKRLDLSLVTGLTQLGKPIFLSGGLNPDNVKDAVEKIRPFCVDVSSGVEKEPGKKDPKLVARFIQNAKSS